MKVLHLCDSIIGGTGSYLTELLPAQVAIYGAGNVALLIPGDQERYIEDSLRNSGVEFIFFSRPRRARGVMNLARSYHRLLKTYRPAIIHAHSWGAGLVTRVSRRPRGSSIIFCSHGWAFDINSLGWTTKRALALMERVLAARADHIIAISRHEFERGRDIGIPAAKMSVIVNSISGSVPTVRAEQWDDKRLRILFAGRFDRQKGLDILLRAIEPLHEKVTVRAIGEVVVSAPGSSETQPSWPHVTYLSWRGRDGVAAQMLASDLLVVPSRWEGFGLVALEAMRLSVPVAASAVGGLKEILGDGEYGFLFPPDDAEGLRQCIEALTIEKLNAMARKGNQRFLDDYRADKMVHGVERVYNQLAATRPIADPAQDRLPESSTHLVH